MEIYKKFNEDLQVSNYGNIIDNNNNKVQTRLINGYPYVDYNKRMLAVHRMVVKTFLQDGYQENLWVNHKDLDRTNNRVDNLEMVTAKENTKHYRENKS